MKFQSDYDKRSYISKYQKRKQKILNLCFIIKVSYCIQTSMLQDHVMIHHD